VPFAGQPIRPGKASISVWLRGRAAMIPARAFRADFDDFVLRKVSTGAARAR
jgi:hypothetical protein